MWALLDVISCTSGGAYFMLQQVFMVWSPVGFLDCTAVVFRGYLCDVKVDFPVLAVKNVGYIL